MAVTPKQELFAQALASGMSQADAYRASFTVKPTTKPESVQVAASRLMANDKVRLRVDELKAELSAKALWTREESVKTLADIAKDHEAKQADKINAVKALNSMHGFDAPQQVDMNVKQFPTSVDDLI